MRRTNKYSITENDIKGFIWEVNTNRLGYLSAVDFNLFIKLTIISRLNILITKKMTKESNGEFKKFQRRYLTNGKGKTEMKVYLIDSSNNNKVVALFDSKIQTEKYLENKFHETNTNETLMEFRDNYFTVNKKEFDTTVFKYGKRIAEYYNF